MSIVEEKSSPLQRVLFILFPLWTLFLLFLLFFFFSRGIALALGGISIFLYLYFVNVWTKDRVRIRREMEKLSLRLSRIGEEGLKGLPIAIILYDEEGRIEWHNEPLLQLLEQEEYRIGEELKVLFPQLPLGEEKELAEKIIPLGVKWVRVIVNPKERVLYLQDVTEEEENRKSLLKREKAVALIQLDNVEEATQGMEEQQRALSLSRIASILNDWGNQYKMLLRRTSSDKYIAFFDYETLQKLEQNRFDVLDKVRGIVGVGKMPFTLSIGVAEKGDSYLELGRMAQEALEIALGRGGDQVVVKTGERLSFYGGKTGAVEKRTRVRARVISHALRDLIVDSDQVLIMGHRMGDFDSIGASLGCARIAAMNGKKAYILLEGKNQAIERLMSLLEEQEETNDLFIHPSVATEICTPRTLLIVVDTHRSSLLVEPNLLKKTDRVMVIDHHRRTEEAIEDPILFYLEPYASSTSELVTELIQYQEEPNALKYYEATALLAGMTVDTRHFTYRTGVRTFEAASFLRKMGADTGAVQALLKEELSMFVMRSKLVSEAEMIYNEVAIAVGKENQDYPPLIIAQAADTLLDMEGVTASFVLAKRTDGKIGISARSLGEMNVQLIMEELGGGGHFTNAATQLTGMTLEEARKSLIAVIEKHLQEGSAEE